MCPQVCKVRVDLFLPQTALEQVFKQILGGCSGVINGLGTLRNKHGDAHGDKPKSANPKKRHAELAVNLAGAMALF
ncbi:abortive infection family protein [Vibrio furnissii]|uniref:abortive infection family protein n=1 Tax=Vibrio TaxID=662 RepID=UPI0030B92CC2